METVKPAMVAGATGKLGTEICRQLRAANKNVKALVRTTSNPATVKALHKMGVETRIGDIKNRASLDKAFAGVGTVISTVSSTMSRQEGDNIDTVDRQGQLNVIDAAATAGVAQFVYISFLESPESFPLQDAKRVVEKRIQESNMRYTILRPTLFMEVWLGPQLGFDPANNKVTIYGHGANKISWIATKDVAAFVVAALGNEAAHNRIIDLGGPEALSPLEVVRLFEAQNGEPFQIQYVPEEALRAQKESAQDPLQQSFAAMMVTYAGGAEVPMEEILTQFPVNLTSVSDYRDMLLGIAEAAM